MGAVPYMGSPECHAQSTCMMEKKEGECIEEHGAALTPAVRWRLVGKWHAVESALPEAAILILNKDALYLNLLC
jgi:hypothetical protein